MNKTHEGALTDLLDQVDQVGLPIERLKLLILMELAFLLLDILSELREK